MAEFTLEDVRRVVREELERVVRRPRLAPDPDWWFKATDQERQDLRRRWRPLVEKGVPQRFASACTHSALTPEEAFAMHDLDLLELRNLGPKTIAEARRVLTQEPLPPDLRALTA
jgi:hypothetical protein